MAVYKATHCYPMLNNLDARVVVTSEETKPVEFLKCKIDTSNKPITGYSVRILDSLNNQLFPVDGVVHVSPISELDGIVESDDYVNTGLNGTFLHIPFFQNKNTNLYSNTDGERISFSYNAIYYQPRLQAHHVLETKDIGWNGWEYDSTSQTLINIGWDGQINGEMAICDEIVLSLSTDNTTGGIWQFQSDGSLKRYNIIRGLAVFKATFDNIKDCGILITRGNAHNTVYTYESSKSAWATSLNNGWEDCSGRTINWHNTGDSYKWEITLYQGEGIINNDGVNPLEIKYDNMDYTWYDMTLQTGTICGTTPKRLQLGDRLGLDASVPAGSDADPLVIQGRYVQLYEGEVSNPKAHGTRAYVQSYDSSYGFAYPTTGSFTASDIEACNFVQVYKYSNDPDAILASDTVKYATSKTDPDLSGFLENTEGEKSTFDCYTVDEPDKATSNGKIDDVDMILDYTVLYYNVTSKTLELYKVTKREVTGGGDSKIITVEYTKDTSFYYDSNKYYAIKRGTSYGSHYFKNGTLFTNLTIDGCEVTQGDLVLVMNQTNAKENGVYTVNSGIDKWTRSGSYNSWGDFIGKIIYVSGGATQSGKNFEAIANAGGTLYTGTTATTETGASPLYFTEEKPLVLFPELLYRKDIDLATNSDVSSSISKIDGVTITGTMIVLSKGCVYEATNSGTIDNPSMSYTLKETLDQDHKLYIKSGKEFGHSVVLYSSSSKVFSKTSTLYCAYLLKNTKTLTYISPYVGLKSNMAIKLQNYKTVKYVDGSESEWISILAIGKNTYCIQHNELIEALKSYSETDSSTPYTYEIRSFYRSSDECVFYCYETPYLKLTPEGSGYLDLITWHPYEISGVDQYDEYEVLMQEGLTTYWNFLVKGPSLQAIADRYVTLQGYYFQPQQLSWVSYRWVLTNSAGDIIQDTGKKFDKKMEVSFYGLSNETDNNVYYAILYVEDELKQTLTFTIKMIVDPTGVSSLNLPFHATYECQTHSVVLEYDDNGQILPSVDTENNVAIGYIEENSTDIVKWDKSVYYKEGKVHVSGADQNNDTQTVDIYVTKEQEKENISLTEEIGLSYSHYYPSDETEVASDSHLIELEGEGISLNTNIKLDDNYCGDFFTVDIGDDTETDKKIRISLSVEPSMSATGYTLSSNRYYVKARLEALNQDAVVGKIFSSYIGNTDLGGNFNWHNQKDIQGFVYYTLQPVEYKEDILNRTQSNDFKYADFQYTYLGQSYKPVYRWDENKEHLYGSYGMNLFGNLCLAGDDYIKSSESLDIPSLCDNNISFWNEQSPTLLLTEFKNPLDNDSVQYVTMATDGSLDSYQSWPSAGTKEETSYWVENISDDEISQINNNVILFEEGTFDCGFGRDGGYGELFAMPRHYGILSFQNWDVDITFKELDSLYTQLSNSGALLSIKQLTSDLSSECYGIGVYYTNNLIGVISLKQNIEEE